MLIIKWEGSEKIKVTIIRRRSMKNSLVVMFQPKYAFTAAVTPSMAHTD